MTFTPSLQISMPHYTILPVFLSTDAAVLRRFSFYRFSYFSVLQPQSLPCLSFFRLPLRFFVTFCYFPIISRYPFLFSALFRPSQPCPVRSSSLRPCLFPVPAFSPDAPLFSSFFFLLPAPTVFPYLFPLSSSSLSSSAPLLFPGRLSARFFHPVLLPFLDNPGNTCYNSCIRNHFLFN